MSRDKHLPNYWRPLKDGNLRMPEKPCLIDDLKFFTMPDGLGIQVRGGESVVVLKGKLSETAIPWLMGSLDGSRTIEDLFAQCPEEIEPEQLSRALVVMFNRGLFAAKPDQGRRPIDEDDYLRRKQLMFYGRKLGLTRANLARQEVETKIEDSRVVLIGDGLLGTATFDVMTRSGLNVVHAFDWSNDGLMSRSISHMVPDAANEITILSRQCEPLLNTLADILSSVDLLVTATTSGSRELFQHINTLCLRHSVKWLRGNDDGISIEIGPLVVPYGSACYRCMILRRISAAEHAIEEELYETRLAEIGEEMAHKGEFLPGATIAAGALSAEAVRCLSKLAMPSLENCLLKIGFDGSFTTRSFLRVPRCPDCYRGEIDKHIDNDSERTASLSIQD